MAFQVPVAAPPIIPNGGSALLTNSCTVTVPYDIGQEFPTDPLRLFLAWVNIQWKVVGVYNGK